MKVLVVEDDQSVRETLGMVLEAFGHQPSLTADADEAIESLEREWPDAMLLDLTLGAMTGEDVYRRINSHFGRVPPVVILSAMPQGENRARELPGAWFLAKPYTIEELMEVLQTVSAQRAA